MRNLTICILVVLAWLTGSLSLSAQQAAAKPDSLLSDSVNEGLPKWLRFSGEVLREMGDEFWEDTEWKLTVTDNAGAKVLTLKFSAEAG